RSSSKRAIVVSPSDAMAIGRCKQREKKPNGKRLLLQKSTGSRIFTSAALDLFVKEHLRAKNRTSTQKEHERILRKHFAPLFTKRLQDISKQDILNLIRPLSRTPSAANHAFTVIRIFFRWAL